MNDKSAQKIITSGIAHEINNKLTTIIGTVDLLLAELDGQSEISQGLRDILAAALKIQDLVDQIPREKPV